MNIDKYVCVYGCKNIHKHAREKANDTTHGVEI